MILVSLKEVLSRNIDNAFMLLKSLTYLMLPKYLAVVNLQRCRLYQKLSQLVSCISPMRKLEKNLSMVRLMILMMRLIGHGWTAPSQFHLYLTSPHHSSPSILSPVSKMGLAYHFKTKALTQGVLCLPHMFSEGEEPFASCRSKKLHILILHNHCPLFTRSIPHFFSTLIETLARYGSDKRLYHIAETMVGLGHEVSFGGMFVSDLETGMIPFLSSRYVLVLT